MGILASKKGMERGAKNGFKIQPALSRSSRFTNACLPLAAQQILSEEPHSALAATLRHVMATDPAAAEGLLALLDEGWFAKQPAASTGRPPRPSHPPATGSASHATSDVSSAPATRAHTVHPLDLSAVRDGGSSDALSPHQRTGGTPRGAGHAMPSSSRTSLWADAHSTGGSSWANSPRSYVTAADLADSLPQVRGCWGGGTGSSAHARPGRDKRARRHLWSAR